MPSNSPNAGVAVTVIAGGPSGAVAVSTTASTATATTAASVGVTGLYLLSVGSKNPMLEVNLTAGATVTAGTILAPLGAGVGGSCSNIRISTCSSTSPPSNDLLYPSHLPPTLSHTSLLHPGHSHHLSREFPRTRNLASSGLGLSTRVALSGALDGLVNDLDGGLGLPVRVELQVVAFGSTCQRQISMSASAASVARRARVAAHWRLVMHTQELVKVL